MPIDSQRARIVEIRPLAACEVRLQYLFVQLRFKNLVQTEFLTPLADGFVGDDDAPFG